MEAGIPIVGPIEIPVIRSSSFSAVSSILPSFQRHKLCMARFILILVSHLDKAESEGSLT